MRKVFTSPRLENVEAVAELLRAEGIQVKIAESRSYRGSRRSTFTYRVEEDAPPLPSVWIVHADDQPRGRQLLREAGLLESSRGGESSYLPLSLLDRDKDGSKAAKERRTSWIRMILFGLIAIGSVLVFFATRKPAVVPAALPVAATPAPPVIVPQLASELAVYRVNVPGALAKLLIEGEIARSKPASACIDIDNKDPAAGFVQRLQAGRTRVFAKSKCPSDAPHHITIHDYMTDGSGAGSVQLGVDGKAARSVEVERDGAQWRVLRVR